MTTRRGPRRTLAKDLYSLTVYVDDVIVRSVRNKSVHGVSDEKFLNEMREIIAATFDTKPGDSVAVTAHVTPEPDAVLVPTLPGWASFPLSMFLPGERSQDMLDHIEERFQKRYAKRGGWAAYGYLMREVIHSFCRLVWEALGKAIRIGALVDILRAHIGL